MLIVSGSLHVDPGVRAEYLANTREVVEAARRAPGCLDFAVSADLIDDGRINVFERWASAEELEAFRGSGPDDTQIEQLREIRITEYEATPRWTIPPRR